MMKIQVKASEQKYPILVGKGDRQYEIDNAREFIALFRVYSVMSKLQACLTISGIGGVDLPTALVIWETLDVLEVS